MKNFRTIRRTTPSGRKVNQAEKIEIEKHGTDYEFEITFILHKFCNNVILYTTQFLLTSLDTLFSHFSIFVQCWFIWALSWAMMVYNRFEDGRRRYSVFNPKLKAYIWQGIILNPITYEGGGLKSRIAYDSNGTNALSHYRTNPLTH